MTRRAFFLWIIFAHKAVSAFAQLPELTYRMDLTSLDDDSFFVQLDIKKYPHSSALFQFPMTAPGTYAILDAGRFVGSFSALDTSGHELTVTRTSVNQFRIDEARRLARIVYKVNDSFGERIGENPIHPMGGTNIEPDNIV
ncbi:MAG TPA: peptidase M61, partial [bacterium]|nr:peptidase M61 [bacterium]